MKNIKCECMIPNEKGFISGWEDCKRGCNKGYISMRKPKCKLSGTNGNVFAIIGKVTRTLKENNQDKQAIEFQKKALSCHSYDKVLQLIFDYCDAE